MIDKDKHRIDESESTEAYLHLVSKHKILSNDATMELFRRYWKGEQQAFTLIAEGHLQLVIKIASSFKESGIPIDDLIQEGNMGLLLAITQFKESHEGKFVSYANLCIYQSIKEAIDNMPLLIRLPHNQQIIHQEVQNVKDITEKCTGIRPSLNWLFIREESTADRIAYYDMLPDNLQDICEIQDLDSIADLSQNIEDERGISDIEPYLKKLDKREKYILLEYCSGESLSSIGRELNISSERVRQIIEKSVKKIKSYIKVRESIVSKKNYPSPNVQPKQVPSYEAIGFGFNNQACKINKGPFHKSTEMKTFAENDYDLPSHKLHEAISCQEERQVSNHVAGKQASTSKSKALSANGISVGDKIKYNTSFYTVDAKVLDINVKRNLLIIQYDNGVIDEVDFNLEQIEVVE